jgi:hypothetical protein
VLAQGFERIQVFAVPVAQEAFALAGMVELILKANVVHFAPFGWTVIDEFQLRQLEALAEIAGDRPDEIVRFLAGNVQGQDGRLIDRWLAVQSAETLGLGPGLAWPGGRVDGRARFGSATHCSSFLKKELPRAGLFPAAPAHFVYPATAAGREDN